MNYQDFKQALLDANEELEREELQRITDSETVEIVQGNDDPCELDFN